MVMRIGGEVASLSPALKLARARGRAAAETVHDFAGQRLGGIEANSLCVREFIHPIFAFGNRQAPEGCGAPA